MQSEHISGLAPRLYIESGNEAVGLSQSIRISEGTDKRGSDGKGQMYKELHQRTSPHTPSVAQCIVRAPPAVTATR